MRLLVLYPPELPIDRRNGFPSLRDRAFEEVALVDL
jgi:hypothetical protein